MERLFFVSASLALVCGCYAAPMACHDAPSDGAGTSPGFPDVASCLTSAGENEWRKEIDIGDIEFDDVGMPLVSTHERRLRDFKGKHWGVRLGGLTEVNLNEDYGTVEEVRDDGPTGGAYVSLGGKGWWFALELGLDVASIEGEYYDPLSGDTGGAGGFNSTVMTNRIDFVVYFGNALRGARMYIVNGIRVMQESTEIYTGDETATYDNSSAGFGVAFGMVISRFLDIRVDRTFDGDDDFGMTSVTTAIKF